LQPFAKTAARLARSAKRARKPDAAGEKFDSAQAVEAAAGDDPTTPESSPAAVAA